MFEFIGALTPWQWAAIGGAAFGIVLLYFLKLRREPQIVPSTLIWLKTTEDLHVNRPFRWLRANILLILQLLLVALLLLALLRPTVHGGAKGVARYVILIDTSASMGATDVSPNRLEYAKEKAIDEVVDGVMDSNDMAMVVAFNDTASVVASYTSDKDRLRRAIRSIALTHRSTDITPALQLVEPLANPDTVMIEGEEVQPEGAVRPVPATVVLYSDGGFTDVPEASLGDVDIVFRSVGQEDNNVGIAALAARENESKPGRIGLFVRVANVGQAAEHRRLQLLVEETPVGVEDLSVPAQSATSASFELTALRDALVEVRLDGEDALPFDNVAYLRLRPPQPVRVALVTAGNRWLEFALSTSEVKELAEVDVISPEQLQEGRVQSAFAAGQYNLVISDGIPLPESTEANTILFGVAPPNPKAARLVQVAHPVIIDTNSSHPLLQYVDLATLRIVKGFAIDAQAGAVPLARSTAGTIICEIPRGYYRDCVVGFRLLNEEGALNTDWPVRVSFPVFLMNALRAYGRAELTGIEASLRPGQPFHLDQRFVPRGASPVVLTPRGTKLPMTKTGTGYVFGATDLVGIYKVLNGEKLLATFTVSMLNQDESNIAVRHEAIIGGREIRSQEQRIVVRSELWPWAVLLAFAICLTEWYVYNRRVAI